MPLLVYPTARGLFLMALSLPLGVILAVAAPALWALSGLWVIAVLSAMALDAFVAANGRALEVDLNAPPLLYVGEPENVTVTASFTSGALPASVTMKLETNERLDPVPDQTASDWEDQSCTFVASILPHQRGTAELPLIWLKWLGPFGLIGKRLAVDPECSLPITPNTKWVRDQAVRFFSRHADFGIKTELDRGDGSEFDALKEFQAGMDRRAIDWKQSARHNKLVAKEFRTERNHNIVLAYDTSRLMCEPIAGLSRLDRAVSAGLLLSYVSLRAGDRVSLFGFDASPNVMTGAAHGPAAYPQLQAHAADLAYSTADANFTLGLTSLASRLSRRSLIILFTEFVDTTHAELMIQNVARLSKRHLVLFSLFNDEDLDTLARHQPDDVSAIGRAVVAESLLTERALVLKRLQRLGVQVLETPAQHFGVDVLNRYLTIKRQELL